MVDADQFAAGEHVLAVHAQELFQSLLLAVGELQEKLVGGDSSVEVEALELFEVVGQCQLRALLGDEGQVEIVAVEMNEIAVPFGEIKESLQDFRFLLVGFCQPLDRMPFPGQEIGAADQIQIGGFRCKASGLNVEKKDALQRRKPIQGIEKRKILQCFLRNSHGSLRFHNLTII